MLKNLSANYKKIVYFLFFVLIVFFLTFREIKFDKQFFYFDTVFNISVWMPWYKSLYVFTALESRLDKFEKRFSVHIKESPASLFNEQRAEFPLDPDFYEIFSLACEVWRNTDGKFDITIFPAVSAYGFYSREYHIPDQNEIAGLKRIIGFDKLLIKTNRLIKKNLQIKIDLGGIAKGYAIDQLGEYLKTRKISRFIIEGGGDVLLGKLKPGNLPYKVGIQEPRSDDIYKIIEVHSAAIVTSGDYRRFFITNNIRYHHIIDPHLLVPSRSCASVTVLASNAALADALCTAFFILGEKWFEKNSSKFPGVQAWFIKE